MSYSDAAVSSTSIGSGSVTGNSISATATSSSSTTGVGAQTAGLSTAMCQEVKVYSKLTGTQVVSVSGPSDNSGSVLGSTATPSHSQASVVGASDLILNTYSTSTVTNNTSGSQSVVISTPGSCAGTPNGTTGAIFYSSTWYGLLGTFIGGSLAEASKNGGSATSTSVLNVSVTGPAYSSPVVNISGPNNITTGNNSIRPFVGEQLRFTITGNDPDDGPSNGSGLCLASWNIKNGAGSIVTSGSSSGFISTINFTPTYSDLNYLLTYNYLDNEGVTTTATQPFKVNPKRIRNSVKGGCTGGNNGVPSKSGNSSQNQPGGGNGPIGGDNCSYAVTDPSTGNVQIKACDPVSTRGYPLKNNIYVNSMRRRWTGVTEMGNAEFSYNIRLYAPSLITPSRGYIVDGNGMEYDYGVFPSTTGVFTSPEGGVYGTLTKVSSGSYTLTGAGAPESINEAGNYSYEFNGLGALTKITDPSGNVQNLNYSGGLLVSVDDVSTGRSITFSHDAYNNISQVTEGGGEAETYITYDSSTHSLVTKIEYKNSLGVTERQFDFTYNGQGLVDSIKQDNDVNKTVTVSYTDAGVTNPYSLSTYLGNLSWSGGGTSFNYYGAPASGNASRTIRTNAQGQVENSDYDISGNLVRYQGPALNGQSSGAIITMTYDSNRNLLTWSDGTTSLTMTYNASGKLLTLSATGSRSWTYTYSGGVDLTSLTDAVGSLYTLTYGDPSNPHSPTTITDSSSNTWTYTYNSFGQLLTVVPPSGSPTGTTTYTYENNSSDPDYGYRRSITNGAGNVTTYDSYSPLGDVTSITTNPAGGITSTSLYVYDSLRRLIKATHPDGKYEERVYDGRDMTDVTDEGGTVSSYTHCPDCGQVTGAIYPSSKSLAWTVNGDHNVTNFADANNSTTFQYGNAGELKKITYPDSYAIDFSYKTNGQPQYIGPLSGGGVSYSYDSSRRLTGITTVASIVTKTYRTDDLPSTITDQAGVRTYSYNTNRTLQKVSYKLSALSNSNTQELIYTYNPDSSVDTLTWKNAGTTVMSWTYSYDGAGRVSGISNSASESTSYTYDGEGKILTQSNQNGTSETKTYNEDRDWPTLIEQKLSGTTFASYAMVYDGGSDTVGNLTRVTEYDGSVVTYGYDALYRLTSETRTGTGPYTKSYGYDLANNVTSINGSAFANYDNANKFSTISGGSKSYNSAGDLTAASYSGFSLASHAYDYRHKLETSSAGYHYYNDEGIRSASRSTVGGSTWRVFLYDQAGRMVGEVNPSGPLVAYTWGPSGIVSERLLTGTPKSLWYHFGPQGETKQLTDSTGTVTDSYRYSAYGIPTASSGSNSNSYKYGGKFGYYTDSNAANIILAGQRWYSPGLYRWMTRDPINYDGGDNTFAYVKGNPVKYIDPDGTQVIQQLEPEAEALAGEAAAAIIGIVHLLEQWCSSSNDEGTCSCQHRDIFTSNNESCQTLRELGICGGPYKGVGNDTASCQSNARSNAPEACRGCLGHCKFMPGK